MIIGLCSSRDCHLPERWWWIHDYLPSSFFPSFLLSIIPSFLSAPPVSFSCSLYLSPPVFLHPVHLFLLSCHLFILSPSYPISSHLFSFCPASIPTIYPLCFPCFLSRVLPPFHPYIHVFILHAFFYSFLKQTLIEDLLHARWHDQY